MANPPGLADDILGRRCDRTSARPAGSSAAKLPHGPANRKRTLFLVTLMRAVRAHDERRLFRRHRRAV
jgi:hypothetical protein